MQKLQMHRMIRAAVQLHRNECGQITIVNLAVFLSIVLLFVFTVNVSHLVTDKVDQQHAADSVAISVGTLEARYMNALTCANHLIGEVSAFVIVHESIGGEWLDQGKKAEDQDTSGRKWFHNDRDICQDLRDANSELDLAYYAASAVGAQTTAYQLVRQKRGIYAGATLLASKIELKELLVWCYWQKVAAKAMQRFPPTAAAGAALEAAMNILEAKIYQEYQTLKFLHAAAEGLRGLKQHLRDQVLPDLKYYTSQIVKEYPDAAQAVARLVAEHTSGDYLASTFPVQPQLPVTIDPHATAMQPAAVPAVAEADSTRDGCCDCQSERTEVTRDQIVKTTQLARATFPWVTYHRKPILDISGALLTLAKSKKYYKHYTDGYSKRILNHLQLKSDMGLFVLKGYPAPDKGFAEWTQDGTKANDLFSSFGMVWSSSPSVVGTGIFGQHYPDGRTTLSMTLLYNANPQEPHEHRIDLTCKRITPNVQPVVGMDTLNWKEPVTELVAKTNQGGAPSDKFPQIRLNWQAKLVPITEIRLKDLLSSRKDMLACFSSSLKPQVSDASASRITH
ncbi:MAG: Tad domain-containing protein [Pirellulaceae bacterium]